MSGAHLRQRWTKHDKFGREHNPPPPYQNVVIVPVSPFLAANTQKNMIWLVLVKRLIFFFPAAVKKAGY